MGQFSAAVCSCWVERPLATLCVTIQFSPPAHAPLHNGRTHQPLPPPPPRKHAPLHRGRQRVIRQGKARLLLGGRHDEGGMVGPVGGAAPGDIAQRLRGHERRRHLLSLLCLSGRCCLVCLVFFGGVGVRGCVGTRIARFRSIRSVSMGFDSGVGLNPFDSIDPPVRRKRAMQSTHKNHHRGSEGERGRHRPLRKEGLPFWRHSSSRQSVCQSVCCTRTSPCIAEGTHHQRLQLPSNRRPAKQ